MSDPLLPCPFCDAAVKHVPHDGAHWFCCTGCGSITTFEGPPATAIAAWNLRARPCAPATVTEEIRAWSYELATYRFSDGTYGEWRPYLTSYKPCVPEDSIRNLTPLVALTPSPKETER